MHTQADWIGYRRAARSLEVMYSALANGLNDVKNGAFKDYNPTPGEYLLLKMFLLTLSSQVRRYEIQFYYQVDRLLEQIRTRLSASRWKRRRLFQRYNEHHLVKQ